ncbi:MAG: protease modulator HflC [Pseudomonadota bacterium]
MMNRIMTVLMFAIPAILIFNPFFVIKETERAVMLEFSKVVEDNIKPGLHMRIPLVNVVKKYDARILTLDAKPESYLTREKEVLFVDSFAKWRIADVKKFYTSTSGDLLRAETLLMQRISDGLKAQFGRRTKHQVISEERDELMTELVIKLDAEAKKELGIHVIDVRVKRIDLPDEVSESVYGRMITERARIAKETRSQGEEESKKIQALADKEKTIILANAFRDAEKIRGEGDAQAASLHATAYKRDPSFYAFYRSMKAYQNSFKSKDDVLVLDSNSEFFKYLK